MRKPIAFLASFEFLLILKYLSFLELQMKKLPTVKTLQAEYAELLSAKKKAYAEYVTVKKSMQEVQTAKANVDRLLGYDVLLNEKEKTQEQR